MQIIQLYKITFRDGFVLNNDSQNIIGASDAAIIVSALCKEPDNEWQWWKAVSPTRPQSSQSFDELYYRVLGQIPAHPSFSRLEC
jgi:hypothetical protein